MPEIHPGPPPMPLWVKRLALLAIVVLAVLLIVVSSGEHGPNRHGALGSDPVIASLPARIA